MSSQLYTHTPLVYSKDLARRLKCNVFLKLETLQPSGSFKSRGIGHFCSKVQEQNPKARLVIASGGNAALACSQACAILNLSCAVFLPLNTPASVICLLQADGAEVFSVGQNHHEALTASLKYASKTGATSVPAYDNPWVMEGNSSIIDELKTQLSTSLGSSSRPFAILASVGGGGLLGGLLLGSKRVGWEDTDFVAVETFGSNCFHQSIDANLALGLDQKNKDPILVAVDQITSKASSLGARTPALETVRLALGQRVTCLSISDELGFEAARQFLGDSERIMVELGCSVTLAPAYEPDLLTKLLPDISLDTGAPANSFVQPQASRPTVIFIICGGSKVSMQDLIKGTVKAEGQDIKITHTLPSRGTNKEEKT